jgi:hypothetical protein
LTELLKTFITSHDKIIGSYFSARQQIDIVVLDIKEFKDESETDHSKELQTDFRFVGN